MPNILVNRKTKIKSSFISNLKVSLRQAEIAFVLIFSLALSLAYPLAVPEAKAANSYPSGILDLTNWKLTLPTGKSKSPTEITQTLLAKYISDPYFRINSSSDGVVFRAPVNGTTTSGSGYPRSELREMNKSGTEKASWSTTSGTHTMLIDQAITAVPKTKKHVVAGQIHGSSDDVIVIRLEYPKLFIDINGKTGPTLDEKYTLGKRFTVKFAASGGKIKIYYNGSQNPAYTLSKSSSGNYFKAGAYTQSNCSKESDCSSNNYGEVVIYKLLLNDQVATASPVATPEANTAPVSTSEPTSDLLFEAESGTISSPMEITNDDSASNGKYIVQTNDTGTGSVKYTLDIPESGQYRLNGRVISPNGSSDSVYYAFDASSSKIWDMPETITSWSWTEGPSVTLSKGAHTLTIKKREKNTKLDAFELRPIAINQETAGIDAITPFEAENGTLSGGMKVMTDDTSASGSKYMLADSSGSATYQINVPSDGTYRLAGWIKAANGSSDSFYASLDGKSSVTWTLNYPTNDWTYDADDSHTFSLTAGSHTLTLRYREAGARADKLVLVKQ